MQGELLDHDIEVAVLDRECYEPLHERDPFGIAYVLHRRLEVSTGSSGLPARG